MHCVYVTYYYLRLYYLQEYEINSNKHVQNKDEMEQYVKNITYHSRKH